MADAEWTLYGSDSSLPGLYRIRSDRLLAWIYVNLTGLYWVLLRFRVKASE